MILTLGTNILHSGHTHRYQYYIIVSIWFHPSLCNHHQQMSQDKDAKCFSNTLVINLTDSSSQTPPTPPLTWTTVNSKLGPTECVVHVSIWFSTKWRKGRNIFPDPGRVNWTSCLIERGQKTQRTRVRVTQVKNHSAD